MVVNFLRFPPICVDVMTENMHLYESYRANVKSEFTLPVSSAFKNVMTEIVSKSVFSVIDWDSVNVQGICGICGGMHAWLAESV